MTTTTANDRQLMTSYSCSVLMMVLSRSLGFEILTTNFLDQVYFRPLITKQRTFSELIA